MTAPTPLVAGARLQVLRIKQVCQRTGLCRSMIYQLELEKQFPSRVKLTAHAVGWIEDEIQQWLVARVASSRSPVTRRMK